MTTPIPGRIRVDDLTKIIGRQTGNKPLSRGFIKDKRVVATLKEAKMSGGGNVMSLLRRRRGGSIPRSVALKAIAATEKMMTSEKKRRLGSTNVTIFGRRRTDGAKAMVRGYYKTNNNDAKRKELEEERKAKERQERAKGSLLGSEKEKKREKAFKRLKGSGITARKTSSLSGAEGTFFRRQRLGIGSQDSARSRVLAKHNREGALKNLEDIRDKGEDSSNISVQGDLRSSAIEKKEDPWTASNPEKTQRSTGASMNEKEQNKKISQSGSASGSVDSESKPANINLDLPL